MKMDEINMAAAKELGTAIARSGAFPGCQNDAQGVLVAVECLHKNASVYDLLGRQYHIMDGRLTMRADRMLAEFQERGGTWSVTERSAKRAAVKLSIEGRTFESVFTIEQAQAAGYTEKTRNNKETNWHKRPEAMLWARAISDGLKVIDPASVAGTYTPEELVDEGIGKLPDEPAGKAAPVSTQEAVAALSAKAEPKPEPKVEDAKPEEPKAAAPAAEEPKDEPAKAPEPVLQAEVIDPDDPTICHFKGSFQGKKWADLTQEHWDFALKCSDERVPAATKEHIRELMAAKQG